MSFLPDATVPCDACGGGRFNAETLEARYRGRTIADVLEMTAEEAAEFFAAHPSLARVLGFLRSVDLGYLALGQASPTLSGGEAQRLKLVEELGKTSSGRTLFVLDEPTTGLSIGDVSPLVDVLHRLVERGDTILVIEHHLDVVAEADWVVDLGPGAGADGGRIVAEGTPLDLAGRPPALSATARCLRDWFRQHGSPRRTVRRAAAVAKFAEVRV
jgi:excinuclease ABC subunit A